MMKSSLFLLPLALILVVALSSGVAKAERKVEAPRKMVGLTGAGWKPIKNVSDHLVEEVGDFAVSKYNMQREDNLVLLRVVKGESQVVDGVNYKLVIEAKEYGDSDTEKSDFEVVVWVKVWEKFMQLISFTQIGA